MKRIYTLTAHGAVKGNYLFKLPENCVIHNIARIGEELCNSSYDLSKIENIMEEIHNTNIFEIVDGRNTQYLPEMAIEFTPFLGILYTNPKFMKSGIFELPIDQTKSSLFFSSSSPNNFEGNICDLPEFLKMMIMDKISCQKIKKVNDFVKNIKIRHDPFQIPIFENNKLVIEYKGHKGHEQIFEILSDFYTLLRTLIPWSISGSVYQPDFKDTEYCQNKCSGVTYVVNLSKIINTICKQQPDVIHHIVIGTCRTHIQIK
jgi:hypothetical protein